MSLNSLVHRFGLGKRLGWVIWPLTFQVIGKCSRKAQEIVQEIHEDCFPRIYKYRSDLDILYPNMVHTEEIATLFTALRPQDPTNEVGKNMDIHFMTAGGVWFHIDSNKLWSQNHYQILIPTGVREVDRRTYPHSPTYQAIMDDYKKSLTEDPDIPYGSIVCDPYARRVAWRIMLSNQRIAHLIQPYEVYVLDTDLLHGMVGINAYLLHSFVGFRAKKENILQYINNEFECDGIERVW